jgi:hypothetical protein
MWLHEMKMQEKEAQRVAAKREKVQQNEQKIAKKKEEQRRCIIRKARALKTTPHDNIIKSMRKLYK